MFSAVGLNETKISEPMAAIISSTYARQPSQRIGKRVLVPQQKLVIPIVFQPLAQRRFDDREIDHASQPVQAARQRR